VANLEHARRSLKGIGGHPSEEGASFISAPRGSPEVHGSTRSGGTARIDNGFERSINKQTEADGSERMGR